MEIRITAEEVVPTRRSRFDGDRVSYACACGQKAEYKHYGLDDCLMDLNDRLAKIESILKIERKD